MTSLEIGRVCIKTTGREAGHYCAVLKNITDEKTKSKSFVLVTGPKLLTGVKRRQCNVEHLEPTQYTLEIKEDASDEEVLAAFDKAGLVTKFGLKKPSAAEVKGVKKEEKPKVKKEKAKKEQKKK